MNWTLITTLWRQRLMSPVRMAILAMLCGMPLLLNTFAPGAGLATLGGAQGLALTLAAGLIGQDVSSGVLQLLCARPVRRSEYVLSRWMGVGLAGTVVSLVQVAVTLGILAARGMSPSPQDAVLFVATRTLECFGMAAVMAMFSSLIGGFGDLGLYLLAYMAGGVVQLAGQFKRLLWLERAGIEIGASLSPTVDLARVVAASPTPWYPIIAYASTVTLCLALAIVVVNRKELSYAAAG